MHTIMTKEINHPIERFCSLQKFICIAGASLAILLQGCANTGSFAHGINVSNYGDQRVYDVKILYGTKIIPAEFLSASNPLGGFGWNAPMGIPNEMVVTWKTEQNGLVHQAVIPLKDKVSSTKPLANWKVRFYGERMELWRQDDNGPVNANGYFPPRTETKVFP